MNYTQHNFNEDLQFISSFVAMENATLAQSKKILKTVLPPKKLEHLTSSWVGRFDTDRKIGQFGSFFSNIEHKTQGLFLMHWGIEIPEYEVYINDLKSSPVASITTTAPVVIERLHYLLVFFLNHGIESVVNGYSLTDLPKERYGNSYNWGNYILSLSRLEQFRLLTHLSTYCCQQIEKSAKNKEMIKKATPTL